MTGTVKEIRVKEGDKLKVGQVIFTVENGAGGESAREAQPKSRQQRCRNSCPCSAPPRKQTSARMQKPAAAAASAAHLSAAATEFKLPELGENIDAGRSGAPDDLPGRKFPKASRSWNSKPTKPSLKFLPRSVEW